MKQNKPETVDEYIASATFEAQPVLQKLRAIIRETIPDAEEKISYSVPFYKYCGEFVGFAAYAKHVSFGYGKDVLTDELETKLKSDGYRIGKGTLQIRFEQTVPEAEIKKILLLKARINRENQ